MLSLRHCALCRGAYLHTKQAFCTVCENYLCLFKRKRAVRHLPFLVLSLYELNAYLPYNFLSILCAVHARSDFKELAKTITLLRQSERRPLKNPTFIPLLSNNKEDDSLILKFTKSLCFLWGKNLQEDIKSSLSISEDKRLILIGKHYNSYSNGKEYYEEWGRPKNFEFWTIVCTAVSK